MSATKPFYAKLPLRKIVERFVRVSEETKQWPEFRVLLECGHEDRAGNQKVQMRCWQCGKAAGVYDQSN